MAGEEWTTPQHANRYLALADDVPRRAEGEGVLSEQVPRDARRILDLGTGGGRPLAFLQAGPTVPRSMVWASIPPRSCSRLEMALLVGVKPDELR